MIFGSQIHKKITPANTKRTCKEPRNGGTKWASTSYTRVCNPFISGVATLLVTGRGPPCRSNEVFFCRHFFLKALAVYAVWKWPKVDIQPLEKLPKRHATFPVFFGILVTGPADTSASQWTLPTVADPNRTVDR